MKGKWIKEENVVEAAREIKSSSGIVVKIRGKPTRDTEAEEIIERMKERTERVNAELPDLEKVQIPRELTEEELVKLEERRAVTKEYIREGDEKLQDIEEKIREIEVRKDFPSVVEEGTPEYIRELRERYERLVKAKETILTEDEGLQKGFKHRNWVREIKETCSEIEQGKAPVGQVKQKVREVVAKAIRFHRIRKISEDEKRELKRENPGAVLDITAVLGPDEIYGPVEDRLTGRVTPATMGIIGEVRKVRDAAEKKLKEELPTEIERMKQEGTVELLKTLTDSSVRGRAYGFLPASQKEISKGGRAITKSYAELHFLVKVVTRKVGDTEVAVILSIKAVGQPEVSAMFDRLYQKGVYITVNSLRRDDFVVSDSVAAWLGEEGVKDLRWFWMIMKKTLFYQLEQTPKPPVEVVEVVKGAEAKVKTEEKSPGEGEKPKKRTRKIKPNTETTEK